MTGKLSIVGTPIGNLEDITLRALRVLGECDLILAEDTRHTQKLLNHYEIKARLRSLHAHNEARASESIVEELRGGKHYALVSDAGMPLISDPGGALIPLAIEAGIEIEAIPGPSAVLTALALSGLRSDGFRFLGFLPRSGGRRREALEEIRRDRLTSIFFESPHRAAKTVEEFAKVLERERRVVVARELTKRFEELIRGTAAEVSEALSGGVRGEITILIEGAAEGEVHQAEEIDLARFLEESRARGEKPREASKRLAAAMGISGAEAYRLLQDAQQEARRSGDG